MSDTKTWISWLIVLMGLGIGLWSWQVWRKPGALSPDSVMYRFFYVRWHAWHQGKRGGNNRKLADNQIRYYAIRGIVVGIALVIVGLVMVWMR